MFVDKIQSKLSEYQLTKIAGPLIVSPVKAILSIAQTITGIAIEVIFGVLASVADIFSKELSVFFDDLCHKGVSIRNKGFKNFLSAGYNLITFGTHEYWFEEELGLRYRKVSNLKP
jgi:hypothetical protein